MNLLRFVILYVLFLPLKPLNKFPWKWLGNLFGSFPTLVCLIALLPFIFWIYCKRTHPFSIFWLLVTPFPNLIIKKKKEHLYQANIDHSSSP